MSFETLVDPDPVVWILCSLGQGALLVNDLNLYL